MNYRGTLSIVENKVNEMANKWISKLNIPKQWIENREERDGKNFHITILNSEECKEINEINILDEIEYYDLGIGKVVKGENVCYYVVIDFPQGDKLREELKLPKKDFHITLAFSYNDIHGVNKGVNTIIEWNNKFNLTPLTRQLALDGKINDTDLLNELSISLFKEKNKKELTIISETLFELNQMSGLYFKGFLTGDNEEGYNLFANTKKTWVDYKNIFSSKILNVLNSNVLQNLGFSYRAANYSATNYSEGNKGVNSNKGKRDIYKWFCIENGKINKIKIPRNFSFITSKIAGAGLVREKYQKVLEEMGIHTVINLTETPTNYPNSIHFPINDLEPPTTELMLEIVETINKANGKVLIHCMGGVGRTATVIIAYLMWENRINRQEAEKILTNRRTNLTNSQIRFLGEWYGICNRPRNPCKLTIKLPNLLFMVGLPASGKTTFSSQLYGENIVRVSQDEIRTKNKCEELVGKYSKNKIVILDRCNLTKEERKYWLSIGHNQKAWAVFFNINADECKERIKHRKNHPTVQASQGISIINSTKNKLEPPTEKEGFAKIFVINSIEESNKLLESWGIKVEIEMIGFRGGGVVGEVGVRGGGVVGEVGVRGGGVVGEVGVRGGGVVGEVGVRGGGVVGEVGVRGGGEDYIMKYPRTKHIINLGAATRDDLLMSKEDVKIFYGRNIIVEEKIDGANMGISIDFRSSAIKVQNRSHYVNTSTHAQFKPLGKWLQDKSSFLFEILEPNRHILFGEWVHAKHSIHYNNLPGWFIVFDLYDKVEKKYYSRNRLEKLLDGKIPLIPKIFEGVVNNEKEMLSLLQKSNFYDGIVEGLVVRICDDNWLLHKGKIVRNDFICGNEHWAKGKITPNKISLEQSEFYSGV